MILNVSANSVRSGGLNKKPQPERKVLFQSKCTMKSHFDTIRGLHFTPSGDSLVSASEDTTLKLWDVKKF